MLHVAKGNMKIGGTLNVSLPPVKTCLPNVPCAEKCYARKSYRQYENVRHAWDENLELYLSKPSAYFSQLWARLSQGRKSPQYFRWHVAGEIVDDLYFKRVVETAKVFPQTKFLIYTRYPFENIMPREDIAKNLSIVKSYWLGFDRPYDPEYPGFMVIAKDDSTRFMDELSADQKIHAVIPCPGRCTGCRACWDLAPGDIVTNHMH